MLNLTLNLSKELAQELEKDFEQLEKLTKKSRDFHIKKALVNYLEHANKMVKIYVERRKEEPQEYSVEELLEHLNLKDD